jgi:CHAT domain-containing protein
LSVIGNRKRLYVAPDGELTRLPFEILPINEINDHKYLIDDYYFSYLSTGRELVRFKTSHTASSKDPLVLAHPDYNLGSTADTVIIEAALATDRTFSEMRDSLGSFNPLAEDKAEGELIGNMLHVKPWTDAKVIESQIKAYSSPSILHIATHGFFLNNKTKEFPEGHATWLGGLAFLDPGPKRDYNLESPMLRSGLALAGANTWLRHGSLPSEAEDGILTAEDVSNMDLSNTELAVLSACETGLGDVYTGEGVFGLRRAFVLAGAQTLVMSLWKIPDVQTKELMVDFYQRMLDGKPRAEALRDAQLIMKKKYSNPFYWGAFICQGDPEGLPSLLLERIRAI